MRFTRWIAAFCASAVMCVASAAQVAKNPKAQLPTLVTAHDAHDLTPEEAARAYPVHLHAVVTYYDPNIDSRHGALFVHDSTGSIFVSLPKLPVLSLHAGNLVDVVGVSGAGDYAPIIDRPTVRMIGQSHVPKRAAQTSMAQLLSGSEDGQWVEVEGMVHAVHLQPMNAVLDLATVGGPVSATTLREPGTNYDSLVDSLVRLHANAGPVFNPSRQMVGVRLFFPSLQALKVIQPATSDPYATAALPISRLLRFSPGLNLPHRAHIQGRVTLHWPGRTLCLQQATEGLCMQTPQVDPVHIGQMVDVIGFPTIVDYKATLENPTFRLADGTSYPQAIPITAQQALRGDHDRELVQIEGQLLGQDHAAGDMTLMLRSGEVLFLAVLPKNAAGAGEFPWKDGSVVRVTGVCSVQMDPNATNQGEGVVRPGSVDILLRSVDDVAVLHAPSWWTPRNALAVISVVGLSAFAAFAWIVVLRRRVEQQTQAIRISEERLRHLSQHDVLTGLPNRFLLNDRLSMALKRAGRFNAVLGLLMIDLDGFKEVNDSYGHHAGDLVLCEVADRIRHAVRQTDTVARLGGDEFIVLLPDLRHPSEAATIAAKIVAAIAESIDVGSAMVPVSASVGVCTSPEEGVDAEKLLQCVDAAMYQAKSFGKNRYQVYRAESEKITSVSS
jgi:diguanylate cyclase (GGDEF)-like protein